MTVLRAFLFNVVFYAALIVAMLLALPLFLLPRRFTMSGLRLLLKLLANIQYLFGIRIVVTGQGNIPASGCIIAAKHQSMWETFMLPPLFADPAFIYKKQLGRIPLFGAFLAKMDMVPIDRARGASALRDMARAAKLRIAHGRQVIVFPEGTRRQPGSPPDYKTGIAFLYDACAAPVVPVAHNSGLFWSNYLWRGQKGSIRIEILPPIPPGLARDVFMARLQNDIETASDMLMKEAQA